MVELVSEPEAVSVAGLAAVPAVGSTAEPEAVSEAVPAGESTAVPRNAPEAVPGAGVEVPELASPGAEVGVPELWAVPSARPLGLASLPGLRLLPLAYWLRGSSFSDLPRKCTSLDQIALVEKGSYGF